MCFYLSKFRQQGIHTKKSLKLHIKRFNCQLIYVTSCVTVEIVLIKQRDKEILTLQARN